MRPSSPEENVAKFRKSLSDTDPTYRQTLNGCYVRESLAARRTHSLRKSCARFWNIRHKPSILLRETLTDVAGVHVQPDRALVAHSFVSGATRPLRCLRPAHIGLPCLPIASGAHTPLHIAPALAARCMSASHPSGSRALPLRSGCTAERDSSAECPSPRQCRSAALATRVVV